MLRKIVLKSTRKTLITNPPAKLTPPADQALAQDVGNQRNLKGKRKRNGNEKEVIVEGVTSKSLLLKSLVTGMRRGRGKDTGTSGQNHAHTRGPGHAVVITTVATLASPPTNVATTATLTPQNTPGVRSPVTEDETDSLLNKVVLLFSFLIK